MRIIWSEWTRAWWVPLSCFAPPLMQSSLPVWLLQEPSDQSGPNPDSPHWLSYSLPLEFPWASFVGRSLNIVYCGFIVYCYISLTFCFPMSYSAIIWIFLHDCFNCQLLQIIIMLFDLIVFHLIIVQWLFDDCSLFWYRKCIPGVLIP